jgi:hypothetical protein
MGLKSLCLFEATYQATTGLTSIATPVSSCISISCAVCYLLHVPSGVSYLLLFCCPVCQVRRPLPLSVLLGVLLDAQILGIEMPQERLIRSILADFEGFQVRGSCVAICGGMLYCTVLHCVFHMGGPVLYCSACIAVACTVYVLHPCKPTQTIWLLYLCRIL